jgi:restriction system protein
LINTNFTTIDPYEFEEVVKNLFISKGYESYTTPKSNDYGVDVIAKLDNRVIAIQVKKYSKGNNVSNVDIQKLLGAMTYKDYKATEALFITTSDYTTKAIEQAKNNPIELWDGEKIKNEIEKYLCK